MLTFDILLGREECMIYILPGEADAALQIRVIFFSYKKKCRFNLTFSFADSQGVVTYPYGNWKWSFVNEYGAIT
jgi:hypothetical protein